MRRMRGVVAAVTVAVAVGGTVAGCSTSSKSGAQGGGATATGQASATQTQATQTQSPAVAASSAPAQTSPPPVAASASATASVPGVVPSVDPCQVVTEAEASTLAGASFGPGKSETAGLSKRCTYGGQTLNVFTVEVAQATDATTAQAAWDQAVAQVNAALKQQLPAGVTLTVGNTSVAGIGDKAAEISGTATIQGQTIGISGIYVLSGSRFFGFQDLKLGTPPTAAVMEAQALTSLGRI